MGSDNRWTPLDILGSLSNDDGDVNENSKNALKGFISKTTTLHLHHVFFGHFSTNAARIRRENAYFHVLWRM